MVNTNPATLGDQKKKFVKVLKSAASQLIGEEDPWAKHKIENIPAERVIRHMYNPQTETWQQDESVVKIQKDPFTHGAMRYCYRMKELTPPPQSISNHRFHDCGWARASNYVAKAYINKDGRVDTSDKAKRNVRNDIMLQFEASHWSDMYNACDPPKKILFIRAYALEFPNREGKPYFAVERFISGSDSYGVGFTKHNTNSGFVDENLHRLTPQVFSAYSFYASQGNRLVADIQGVGDLYTDPQVLSSDYRFGDGDLGPRGMALFFKSFRYNTVAASLGIPIFALSKNELKQQVKYENDDFSLTDNTSYLEACKDIDRFASLDLNRSRRSMLLKVPPKEILQDDEKDTEKRANYSLSVRELHKSLNKSLRLPKQPVLARSKSEVDEVKLSLDLALDDFHFDNHRKGNFALKLENRSNSSNPLNASLMICSQQQPMKISDQMKLNLGKVHYQLAVLHGIGRFPDTVPENDTFNAPPHDAFSVLFHLCHASSFQNVPACLALGRLHAGLGTYVSPLLNNIVPVDFEAAKIMLKRAMESNFPSSAPKVAAAFILYQIYTDEDSCLASIDDVKDTEECFFGYVKKESDVILIDLLESILRLTSEVKKENETNLEYTRRKETGPQAFHLGDKVEGNYFLEGTYYPGVVDSVSDDGLIITVKYDDDGSTESLSIENVRMIIPPTATQSNLGGPLTDEEAFGMKNSDENVSIDSYQLKADLAALIAKTRNKAKASRLYEEASCEAMECGKMELAMELSVKSAELVE